MQSKSLLFAFLLTATAWLRADPTVSVTMDIAPTEIRQDTPVTLTITVQNTTQADINLPEVEGLMHVGEDEQVSYVNDNGNVSAQVTKHIILRPLRKGDITIPSFNIALENSKTLPTKPITLHILDGNSPNLSTASAPSISGNSIRTGPVVLPSTAPNNNPTYPPVNGSSSATIGDPNDTNAVPLDKDGLPAKLFLTLSLQHSPEIYLGQSIVLLIRSYIRADVITSQDSLPVLKGGDFLMNSLSTQPQQSQVNVGNDTYVVETWVTAITGLKTGDFDLQLFRETNSASHSQVNFFDPFNSPFSRRPTERTSVPSNRITLHVLPLPLEGKPANFTGAIGNFQANGNVEPTRVTVGEPVTIRFSITGEGNFDRVNCPDVSCPGWKTYPPRSAVRYEEQTRTSGMKNFQLSAVPLQSGLQKLPDPSFSYFNPDTKRYVTLPIPLSLITVTPSTNPVILPKPTTPDSDEDITSTQVTGLLPNHLFSSPSFSVGPPFYATLWFWPTQIGLLMLLVLAIFVYLIRYYTHDRLELRRREQEQKKRLRQRELALHSAVEKQDAQAFFIAARTAVQGSLAQRWNIPPEAITLVEIRDRAPELADNLTPLFTQVDALMFSGQTLGPIDLPSWEAHLHETLAHLEPHS